MCGIKELPQTLLADAGYFFNIQIAGAAVVLTGELLAE